MFILLVQHYTLDFLQLFANIGILSKSALLYLIIRFISAELKLRPLCFIIEKDKK